MAKGKTANLTTALDADKMEEHRKYLLESAGVSPTDETSVSTSKKRKTPQKKASPKRKATDEPTVANTAADAETTEAEKPRKKAKPSPKRKASDEPTKANTAAEYTNDPAEKPAKKQKASPKRKRAASTTEANTGAQAAEDFAGESHSELSPFLAAKVQRVHDFIATASEDQSLLAHDMTNHSFIHVPKLDVFGALIRMRSDYEIGYPFDADLSEIQSCIVDSYTTSVKQYKKEDWLVIDPNTTSELETEIQAKINGWELQNVSLLEVELEMMERQAQKADLPEVMSTPAAMQALLDATWAAIKGRGVQETEVKAEELVKKTLGVCPTPPAIVV